MKNFFLSIKTTVWTLLGLIGLFFLGSYMMPAHRELFGSINDRLLFDWVRQVALDHPWETGWFFAALAALMLLTLNTLVCSIQAVRGRWSRRDFLLRIAPQVVHAGFLFILLAHLLGALSGYRVSGTVPEGSFVRLPENRVLHLQAVRVVVDRSGYPRDWSAQIEVFEGDRRVAAGSLGPNAPLFLRGAGFYLKSFDFERVPMALLMVNKDPGAVWALAGAGLFTVGAATILMLKWKKA
jgi:cytochrome c biogenesis protein ResB